MMFRCWLPRWNARNPVVHDWRTGRQLLAKEPMATADVDVVIAAERVSRRESSARYRFYREKIQMVGQSERPLEISVQISTEEAYREFPGRSTPADIHGILMRVASLPTPCTGKFWHGGTPNAAPANGRKICWTSCAWVKLIPTCENFCPPIWRRKSRLNRSIGCFNSSCSGGQTVGRSGQIFSQNHSGGIMFASEKSELELTVCRCKIH